MTRMMVVFSAFALLFTAVGQTQEKKIAMTPVTYDGLKQEVLKQRGKVLVVDFWFSGCRPCINEGFPHLAEMHKKFASQGLAVVTVSVDDPESSEAVNSANKILSDRNLPFRHVHLLDTTVQERLGIKTVPCCFVFDRSGRWVRFGGDLKGDGVNYEELDKTVISMLKEK